MNIAKKTLIGVIAAVIVLGTTAPSAAASDNDNWRIVKRAVQEDETRPAEVRRKTDRREPRWFKVLILDRKDGGDLKITLPLSLVEGIIQLASHERFKCNGREYDFELSEMLNQLKKAGPMALIEISDDDGLIKVWIE